MFYPRVCFSLFCVSILISLSLLPMKREREREPKRKKCNPRVFKVCNTHFHRIATLFIAIPWTKRAKFEKPVEIFCNSWRFMQTRGQQTYTNQWVTEHPRVLGQSTGKNSVSLARKAAFLAFGPAGDKEGFALNKWPFTALLTWQNTPVSSHIGLMGFGSLGNRCDASRSSPADRAASLSVPPFLVARMGGRKARRFAQAVPGLPTRSSHRPHLVVRAVVFANRTAWRPHMARQSTSSFSPAREELLRDIHEDAQTMSLALSALFNLLQGCDVDHQVSAGGLLGLLEPISGGMETLVGDMGTARNIGVHQ
jgi:hypothetical protein